MKKIFLICCISLCISFCFVSVYAETDVASSISKDGILNVNISTDAAKDTLYTIYLVKSEANLSESGTSGTIGGILKIEQANLLYDATKEFNFASISKNVSEIEKDKAYKVVVGGGELDGKSIDVIYPSESALNAALSALKSAGKSNINAVLKQYQNTVWIVDLDSEEYKNNFAKVNENLVSIIKTSDDVNQSFTNAVSLAKILNCEKDEIINLLLKNEQNFKITYTDVVKNKNQIFVNAFDVLRKDEIINPLLTVLDLSNLLRRAEALGALNEATRENLLDALEKYNDVFNLNFDGDYKLVDSYEVTKKMVANDNPYTSIKSVQDKFTTSVASLMPTVSSGSTGGGGSKSSSSSFGGVSIASGNLTTDIVEGVNKNVSFTDINEAEWAKPYIQYMQDRNIMSGDGDGRVRPNDKVKREEFLKMLLEALKPEISESSQSATGFEDVDENAWYAKYVKDALALKIANGMDENIFGIGAYITRQDAAVMMHRTVETMKKILSDESDYQSFTDDFNISDYAKNSVKALQIAGIISGYETGEFLPQNSVTRAEAAKLIYSVLKNLGNL